MDWWVDGLIDRSIDGLDGLIDIWNDGWMDRSIEQWMVGTGQSCSILHQDSPVLALQGGGGRGGGGGKH